MEYLKYNIDNHNQYAMKVIKIQGKGSVHASLRGLYTDTASAIKAIDFYETHIASKKGGTNGKTGSDSGVQ